MAKALEYASEAFRINEQSRARSLLDLLSETDAAITEGVPVELLKRKQDNLDRQQDIADILTGIKISTEELKKKPAELDAELEKLQTEYEEIENQIRTASPRYATLTANKPLTLAEVQQSVLDDQTVLLEYALQTDDSYLLAVSKSAVSLFKLPARANSRKARHGSSRATDSLKTSTTNCRHRRRGSESRFGSRFGSARRGTAAFVAASNALYKVVLEPAAGMIGEKRLMVVADGALNYVPFEVLLKSADAGDFSSLGYLVKSNEVIYAPSASVVGAIKQQRRRHRPRDADHRRSGLQLKRRARAARRLPRPQLTQKCAALAFRAPWPTSPVKHATPPESADGRVAAGALERHAHRSRADLQAGQKPPAARQTSGWTWTPTKTISAARDVSKYRIIHVATHGLAERRAPAVHRRRALAGRQQDPRRLCAHRRSFQSSPRLASRHAFGLRDRSRQREARRRRHGPHASVHVRRCANSWRQPLVGS